MARRETTARLARLAGAPADKGAGVDLIKKVGDRVERGEPLYRIHAYLPANYKFVTEAAGIRNGYSVAERPANRRAS